MSSFEQKWLAARAAVLVGLILVMNGATHAQIGIANYNVNGQFIVAARAGNLAQVKTLLDAGAAVNSRDRNGDTALNLAARKGDRALSEALLAAGADFDLANIAVYAKRATGFLSRS